MLSVLNGPWLLKARELWHKIAKKYQEQLTYFGSLTLERQYEFASEIVSNVERYRSVVDLLLINQDTEIIESRAEEFNKYLRLFTRLYSEDEEYDNQEAIEKQEQDLQKEFQNSQKPLDTLENIPNS